MCDLADALAGCPEVLDDPRTVLKQLSPGVRGTLVANLVTALESGARPTRAVWMALAITGDEVKLCSAVALGGCMPSPRTRQVAACAHCGRRNSGHAERP